MGIGKWLAHMHDEDWRQDELHQFRQTHLALPLISKQVAKLLLSMRRCDLRSMTMAITGHGFLQRHQALQYGGSPECPWCGLGKETAIHRITFCPFFARVRQWYIGHCCQLHLLIAPDHISDLLSFIKDTDKLAARPKTESESDRQ